MDYGQKVEEALAAKKRKEIIFLQGGEAGSLIRFCEEDSCFLASSGLVGSTIAVGLLTCSLAFIEVRRVYVIP